MRKEVPLIITFLAGSFFIADYFIPHTGFSNVAETVNGWAIIVVAFAYILGVANVVRVNVDRIQRKDIDSPYRIALLVCLFFMIAVGIGWGIREGTVFDWLFVNLYTPMQAMMFALLAFYIASAAFRAFRIRSAQAAMLAITAVIVMMGRVPIGEAVWSNFSELTEWIMNVPQLAGKRAILIGAALGAISTGLKVIVGLERTYLGQD
jgi:cytochrome bd-type quinol oxidase subunit 2